MFVLFHFIFTLFKIFFQASVYATLLLLVFRIIAKNRFPKNKSKFWFKSGLIICLTLFIYSFTYRGDHGLGDSSLIPIGHSKTIHNTDGSFTYFYTADNHQRHIYNYEVRENKLFAEQEDDKYLMLDLETSELTEFESIEKYNAYVRQHNYPLSGELKDFLKHYQDYWNGWRFWFLP